ncbi:hypothetical protein MNL76_00785 [Fervidobacterium riparium]|uniref:LiaF transmembrane domain-containing protein n=1 Tax=Fervidobacterium gondwanense DSM 13020 TaxID=1121883 RepID=A0A1M7SEH1_FERGO|nr:hypothetical protein SAMN02745226_00829 [Fervidobacterium gondwanense DSM 13020]
MNVFWGVILVTAGVFILLSVVFSITSPVWLIFGAIALAGGIISMIKSFPNGVGLAILGGLIVVQSLDYIKMGFWEFVVAIIAAGLIEIGLKFIISGKRKRDWN